jgi:hypothetical protein
LDLDCGRPYVGLWRALMGRERENYTVVTRLEGKKAIEIVYST